MINYAYMAGLIDADGCIWISNVTAGIDISSKHLGFLEGIQEHMGGRIAKNGKTSSGNSFFKLWWSGKGAAKLAREVRVFLRLKQEQCCLLLEYVDKMPGRGTGPGRIPLKRDMVWHVEAKVRMGALNHG